MVVERQVQRLFDPVQKTFLADRFVKGNCPRCGAQDQYGDSCEKCGATYSATELGNPKSVHSGAAPELRPSMQLFVQLTPLQQFLTDWTQKSGALQQEVANYLAGHFLDKPLQDWDVSRPAPYFGFPIPDAKDQFAAIESDAFHSRGASTTVTLWHCVTMFTLMHGSAGLSVSASATLPRKHVRFAPRSGSHVRS